MFTPQIGATPFTFPMGRPADWFNAANPPGGVLRGLAQALPYQAGLVAVPNIGAGGMIEVSFPPHADFVGKVFALAALGLPILPQLGTCGCWIGSGGAVFVRLIAGSGGVTAGDQNIGVVAVF